MKITINRKQLLSIVEKLKPGLAPQDVLEQTSSFVFKNGFVWSFNNESAVSHPLPKQISFNGAVPADPFLRLLEKLTDENLILQTSDEELLISSKKSRAGLALEIPKLPIEDIKMPAADAWVQLPNNFAEAIKLALTSVGGSSSVGLLTCIGISNDFVVGCDNFQLTKAILSARIGVEDFMIQEAQARALLTLCPDGLAHVAGWNHFITKDDVIFSCRAVEGKYPDVSPLLNVEGKEVQFPNELLDSLSRAGVFADLKKNQIALRLDKTGTLHVSARNEFGWFNEDFKLQNGITFEININPDVLHTALTLGGKIVVGKTAILFDGAEFKHIVALM